MRADGVEARTRIVAFPGLTQSTDFLEALVLTLDCSNRPDQVFELLLELPPEAWTVQNVLSRVWVPVLVLCMSAMTFESAIAAARGGPVPSSSVPLRPVPSSS